MVISIAIVSFALIPSLGLLPIGLNCLRDSMSQTAIANISQAIRGELQQISFSSTSSFNIYNLSSVKYYFTREGVKTSAGASDAYYEALLNATDGDVAGTAFDASTAQNVTVALSFPVNVASAGKNQFAFSLLLAKQTGD